MLQHDAVQLAGCYAEDTWQTKNIWKVSCAKYRPFRQKVSGICSLTTVRFGRGERISTGRDAPGDALVTEAVVVAKRPAGNNKF